MLFTGGTASADIQNGLLVTEILYEQEIFANEDSKISVGVVDVKVKEDSGGVDHADPFATADVKAIFTKDKQEIEVKLKHKEDGKYEGAVSFPEPGDWKVVAIAEYPSGHDHDHENNNHQHEGQLEQNVFEAVLNVKEAKQSNYMIWILSFFGVTGVLWILIRKRKKTV
jgi:hypothetical protein